MSANIIDHTGSRDGLLRLAMRVDAVISGVFGIVSVVGWIPGFSGAPRAFGYVVDVFFVGYGLIVWNLAAAASVRRAGIGVVVANLVYTVAAGLLVVARVFPLSDAGVTFAVTSALYTLVCAHVQYVGWRRVKSSR
ncbi:hypothetical protein A5647_08560 [Mycobacterium sp. 1100029.7]|nr:hypothetical protein A5647_08560 [Mycobacterium sp. 1100029.7]